MIPIAREIWEEKYRFAPAGGSEEACIEKSWTRVARAAAAPEKTAALRRRWDLRFYDAQTGFKFLPGGRRGFRPGQLLRTFGTRRAGQHSAVKAEEWGEGQ
jgi:hypothetical protein